jgi:hypothetical protein
LEPDLAENNKNQSNINSQKRNVKSTDDSQAESDLNDGKSQINTENSVSDGEKDSHNVQSSTETSKSTYSTSTSNSTSSNPPKENDFISTTFSQFLQGVPVTIFVISFVVGLAGTIWGVYQLLIQYVGNTSQIWLYSVLIGLGIFTNIWFETLDYFAGFLEENGLSVTSATLHTLKIFFILIIATLTPFIVLGYVTGNLLWSSIAGVCGLVYSMIFFGKRYME